MRGKLDVGELLTGTPTITELTDGVASSDLSFSNQAVNTAALTINGQSVAAGQAVQFKVSGGVNGQTYTIRITVATNATPAQTLQEDMVLSVRS